MREALQSYRFLSERQVLEWKMCIFAAMICNLIFDMGGVIFSLGYEQAIRRFEEIGVANARHLLDPCVQTGLFGDLEGGRISCGTFREELSRLTGRELTSEQCAYAWKGYILDVPQRNLDKLLELRRRGYRTVLLSNTNPFITEWAHSPEFSRTETCPEGGRPMDDFFDRLYFSCDLRMMKPSEEIFSHVLEAEGFRPEETLFIDDGERNVAAAACLGIRTFCPHDNSDWTVPIESFLTA